VVPLARAHERAPHPHARGRGGRVHRGVALSALAALAEELRAEGGLLAEALTDTTEGDERLGDLAGGGEHALLYEAIHEGGRLHYGTGRVVAPADPDLALLGGDRLYAIGLDRLTRLGDVDAVAELADVISLVAQAHAEGDPERAAAVWEAGARALAAGPSPDHEAAKAAWRGAR
jgi:hypothetical protein